MYIAQLIDIRTCREFKIVKIHANASTCSLIANNPITHVLPSMGISVAADIKTVLQKTSHNKTLTILRTSKLS